MIASGAMRPNRSEGDARLAAQITISASDGNCSRRVAISTSAPSACNSAASVRSRSALRALSITRLTKGARQRAQPEPTSPVAPTMSSVDLREVPALQRAHFPDALNDESNRQRIAGGEHRIVPFGKLIEVALDQNGAESAQAHDLRSCLDRAGGRGANAGDVVVDVISGPGDREE